jgi:8-oxo-dGTP pyrophosphatase MutT (NUDIX family)
MNTRNEQQYELRSAATVILARENAGRLQVYLIKRSTKSGFMAGNYVFPGGVVDADDRAESFWQNHIDLSLAELSQRLGGSLGDRETLSFGVAAIRETFEEAGVLFAGGEKQISADLEQLNQKRLSANLSNGWLQNLIKSQQWALSFSGLYRWSHWITPEKMKKRFDTRFFLAAMPADQVCQPDTRETTDGVWSSPHKGLAGNLSGKIALSPPTVVTLHELLSYRSLNDLIQHAAQRPWGEALMPRLASVDKGAVIVEPWDPMYNQKEIRLTSDELAKNVADVGQPFSRLWNHGGIWRPVKA